MSLALPSPRSEGWRWTDLEALKAAAGLPRGSASFDPAPLFLDLAGPKLIFVDGELDPRSDTGRLAIRPLSLETEHPLGLRTRGRPGYEVTLGRESDGQTVQVVNFATGAENHVPAHLTLAKDVPASIVETFVGAGWQNRLTRITLGRGARLMRSVRLLQESGFVSVRDEATIGEGASLVSVFLAAGNMGSRIEGALTLTGASAYAEAAGALLARGRQRHDASFVVRHDQPNGSSRQIWRSVAADQSACSVAARVEVARHAQKTDGEQSLKGLLLDRGATINAKPELEIFADDVKCAHGATVGELDRDAMFYMQSRGVPQAEARALLTEAFVADAVERIGQDAVRAAFEEDARRWFTNPSPLAGEGGARREAVGG